MALTTGGGGPHVEGDLRIGFGEDIFERAVWGQRS